jgi:hypothetical protein
MANSGSNSPLFTPPINRLIGDDAQIVKVPMGNTEFGFRSSQKPSLMDRTNTALKHVKEGR